MSTYTIEGQGGAKNKKRPLVLSLIALCAAVSLFVFLSNRAYDDALGLSDENIMNESVNQMLTEKYGKTLEKASVEEIRVYNSLKTYIESQADISHSNKALPSLSVSVQDMVTKGGGAELLLKLEEIRRQETGSYVSYSVTDILSKSSDIDGCTITVKDGGIVEATFPKSTVYILSTEEVKAILSTFLNGLIKEKLTKAQTWDLTAKPHTNIAGGRSE